VGEEVTRAVLPEEQPLPTDDAVVVEAAGRKSAALAVRVLSLEDLSWLEVRRAEDVQVRVVRLAEDVQVRVEEVLVQTEEPEKIRQAGPPPGKAPLQQLR
jgi:hypothetical protein